MNLRQAAEMALKYFEDAHGLEDTEVAIKEALRQALDLQTAIERGTKAWAEVPVATKWVQELRDNTPDCKTHPDAPHGFDRNASVIVLTVTYASARGGSRQSVNGLG
jgi:hypothetical protein